MREPSLRYVNRVLENKMKEAGESDTKKSSRASANNSEKGDSYQKDGQSESPGRYYDIFETNPSWSIRSIWMKPENSADGRYFETGKRAE